MDQTKSSNANNHALICISEKRLDPDALDFAATITNALGLSPVLFHARSPKTPIEEGDRVLANVRMLPRFESADVRHVEGNAKNMILDELKRRPYNLLVLGTSERNPKLPVSRLSNRVANQANISVLLIRNASKKIEQFLICTGGHETSTHAVALGIKLAKGTGSRVTILHVATTTPSMYTGFSALEEDLSQVLSRDYPLANHLKEAAAMAENAGVKANLELRHGMVIEEILRACEMRPHDLVVMGAPPPRSYVDQVLLGRVGPKLLASSYRPTLIVRKEDRSSRPSEGTK
jgi:nucleotide-binding universal stress UspA family protein